MINSKLECTGCGEIYFSSRQKCAVCGKEFQPPAPSSRKRIPSLTRKTPVHKLKKVLSGTGGAISLQVTIEEARRLYDELTTERIHAKMDEESIRKIRKLRKNNTVEDTARQIGCCKKTVLKYAKGVRKA